MQRLFQSEGLVYADEIPVLHSSIADIEPSLFRHYYENRYEETLEESGLPLPRLLDAMDNSHLPACYCLEKHHKSSNPHLWLKRPSARQ